MYTLKKLSIVGISAAILISVTSAYAARMLVGGSAYAAAETSSEQYIFVPAACFTTVGSQDNAVSTASGDPTAIELIFGDHFAALQVGDTMPAGVYVTPDGTRCYIIDKKADGTVIKTTYTISRQGYSVESQETLQQ